VERQRKQRNSESLGDLSQDHRDPAVPALQVHRRGFSGRGPAVGSQERVFETS